MKKFFKSFALIAAAAMALAACQKEVSVEKRGEDGLYKYSFNVVDGEAKVDAETKAVIEADHVAWVSGDQAGIFIGTTPNYARMDVSTTPVKAILYSTSTIAAGTKAYGYYPYSADNASNTPDAAKIHFATIQHGAETSAMPMAALPFEVETDIDPKATSGNGELKFMNLGSVIVFKVWSSNTDEQTENVQYITLDGDQPMSGDFYLDLTGVSADDESTLRLTVMDEENDIECYAKVEQTAAVADSKANATEIKLVVAPGTYNATLKIGTDAHTYYFELENKTFNRSGVCTFGVNLANAISKDEVDLESLKLPVEESFASEMGAFSVDNVTLPDGITSVWEQKSGYVAASAYKGGNRYTVVSRLVSPWINLQNEESALLTFENAYNYLTNTAGPAGFFSLWVKTDEADWAQLDAELDYGTGSFKYATNEVDLSAYLGHDIKIAFQYTSDGTTTGTGTWDIKNFVVDKAKAEAGISYEIASYEVTLGEDFTAPTLTNPHNLTVTYASTNTSVATVDENSGAVTIVAPGTTTIKASFAGDDDYAAATASYILNVKAATDCVSLPWAYPEGEASATRDGINAIGGVTTNGLGADYAASNAPYQIKLDDTGDYFQIKTDSAIGAVSVKYKMLGGSKTSSLVISESVDGEEWATVETLSIAGSQNSTDELTTTKEFAATSRYVKIEFQKGSNVGIGGLSITKADSRLNADISWSASVGSATITDGVVIASSYPSLTNSSNLTVSYVSSNTTVATVDESTGVVTPLAAGNTNISAVFAGNDTYKPKTVSYVLTVTVNNTDGPVYTLQPATGSNNGYANNCDVTIDGITWNVTGNAQVLPWRVGGKSLTNVDRAIYSKTALNYNIEKIEITHGSASGITVNSMTVIVATDDEFNNVVSTLTPTFEAAATVTVERPSGADWSNCYYKIVYNVTVSGTSNKFFEFTKADFYGE